MGISIVSVSGLSSIALSGLKAHLNLSTDLDDGMLLALSEAAISKAALITGRTLKETTYELTLKDFPCNNGNIVLNKFPVSAINSITYNTSDGFIELDSSLYALETDEIPHYVTPLDNDWPEVTQSTAVNYSVKVNFTAGYGFTSYTASTISIDDDTTNLLLDSASGFDSFQSGLGIEIYNADASNKNKRTGSFIIKDAQSDSLLLDSAIATQVAISSGDAITVSYSNLPLPIKIWSAITVNTLYEQREAFSTGSTSGSSSYTMTEVPNRFVDGLLDQFIIPWSTVI